MAVVSVDSSNVSSRRSAPRWFGKSQRAYNAALPVLDFMQTMPAFVYLIPIIAWRDAHRAKAGR